MASKNVNCTKDLTGVSQAMEEGKTGILSFVWRQSVLTIVADDETAVISFVNGVATIVTPIADGDYVVAAGDDNAIDVDVLIYDSKMNLIHSDKRDSPDSDVEFVPEWTGLFYIVLKLDKCKESAIGADVGILTLYSELFVNWLEL